MTIAFRLLQPSNADSPTSFTVLSLPNSKVSRVVQSLKAFLPISSILPVSLTDFSFLLPSNIDSTIFLMSPLISISSRLVQFLKKSSLISSTSQSISTVVSLAQSLKSALPSSLTDSGITTLSNFVQPSKTESPIFSTLSAISIVVRLVQPEKADSPITSTPSPNSIFVRLVQPLNVSLGISFTLPAILTEVSVLFSEKACSTMAVTL